MIDEKKFDFYIENNLNVLLRGRHGVGKTAMIQAAVERHNLKWKYFSAATMDPWVDFVGVPKEKTENGQSFIELVRPKNFQNDEVEFIFMDELNRSKDKVRNAVMELIQFKSINGVPFKNLRMVWAAINPEDDEDGDLSYDVETLDPAQKDRFHIIMDIPYKPSKAYFSDRFGEAGEGAVEWWKGLSSDENKLVSPRRLEYAVDMFQRGGDLKDVLPNKELNLTQLRQRLMNGSIKVKLASLYADTNAACESTFNNINFTTDAIPHIIKNEQYVERFLEFIPKDIISKLVTEDDAEHAAIIINNAKAEVISPILASIIATNGAKRPILQAIDQLARERGLDLTSESAFEDSVREALNIVGDGRPERYSALHSINHNFNSNANLEVYRDCVRFLALLIHHTPDQSIEDVAKPYNQIGSHIAKQINKALSGNTVMALWNGMTNNIASDKHLSVSGLDIHRVEKYLELFTSSK
jgi:hypothetical protein